ncbi:MAG: hypothetical protein ACTHQ3_15965 [Motilibacteraceae bacterium]
MTAPEYDFTVWRDGSQVHVRGILWRDVVEAFSLDSAARIAHDLETSPDPADRQLAADMLAACEDGAA